VSLYTASAAALAVFMVLGTVDGLYFHLWRDRLHTRPASRREHWVHTWRTLLFAALLPTLFLWQTAGALLWAGLLLLGLDQALELWDMFTEKDSRADLGGLSTSEYVLHMSSSTARGAALALGLAARPAEAWSTGSPWILGPMPTLAWLVAWQSVPGAMGAAVLHLWLCTDAGVRRFEAARSRWFSPRPRL
jgi:hypothetical protein